MKKILSVALSALMLVACSPTQKQEAPVGLKDAFKDKFYFGAALNVDQLSGQDPQSIEILHKHYNAIVAENCMKSIYLQPEEGRFYFDEADRFVAFGEEHGLFMVGHTLVWHSQAPAWFFTDAEGNDVSREVLIERMRKHITTVVSRYKGRVKGWDVVNEAIIEDGTWRASKFYEIIGEDFVKLAFQFAHEADPEAELYYNDYSMDKEEKRATVVKMLEDLRQAGVRIDGIGMQGHLNMDYPPVEEFEKSLLAFANQGVKVMITELDLSILPSPFDDMGADVVLNFDYRKEMDPYINGLTAKIERQWEDLYLDFFKLFLKHSDKISRVTTWGISDAHSWKNNFPIRGRTDYPLLFDRQYRAKPIVNAIISESIGKK